MIDIKPVPIVALISGGGTNLQAIIDAVKARTIGGELRAVISNEPGAYGLERARKASIPTDVINHRNFDSRIAFDQALRSRVSGHNPDLIVMAGFMRILTEEFIDAFAGRILNIHPSLLPKYRGLQTHQRALDGGEKYHGCSVHFATNELDGGPVILQATVPVLHDDTANSLAARVLEKEHIIYPLCVRWYCEGRVAIRNGQAVFDGEPLNKPLLLEELETSQSQLHP